MPAPHARIEFGPLLRGENPYFSQLRSNAPPHSPDVCRLGCVEQLSTTLDGLLARSQVQARTIGDQLALGILGNVVSPFVQSLLLGNADAAWLEVHLASIEEKRNACSAVQDLIRQELNLAIV